MRFSMRFSAFTVGICMGLLVNMLLAPAVRAGAMNPGSPVGPPEPIPDWGESEFIEANAGVYELLFPGKVWSGSSAFRVSGRMISEGSNLGVNDHGQQFILQAFVVDEFDLDELGASLTTDEQAVWENGGVRVSIFYGLIGSEATEWGVTVPVLGCAYSSDVAPDIQLVITNVMDDEINESMHQLWLGRSYQQAAAQASDGDWQYWFNPCAYDYIFVEGVGADCEQLRLKCGDEYDSNMRIAVAAYKVVWATVGVGCIVGGILLASFCLVGNPLACGSLSYVGSRCGAILGSATVALAAAAYAAHVAYLDCLGTCGWGSAGCP